MPAQKCWVFNVPRCQEKLLAVPSFFAVYSVSGNQWKKLMYIYNEWCSKINLLVSIYDVYRADTLIFNELISAGFEEHLKRLTVRMANYVREKSLTAPQYADYIKYFPDSGDPGPFTGWLMLDSGGFSFTSEEKVKILTKHPYEQVRVLGKILIQLHNLETSRKGVKSSEFRDAVAEATRQNLALQLAMQPDIVVVLDRMVGIEDPPEKKMAAFKFNLISAREGLKLKKELLENGVKDLPLFFAVCHPVGPAKKEIKEESWGVSEYARYFKRQLRNIIKCEKELGLKYDGLAVGSLVPVTNYTLLDVIARGWRKALSESGMEERPVHAFGTGDNKMAFLYRYGFTSFDSSLHVVKARTRQVYNPFTSTYQKVHDGWQCQCQFCAGHDGKEFLESRSGLKEVGTVWMSLHNLFANHLAHLSKLTSGHN